ncbi:hypothetical protein [Kineosporia succinea]|uniref:Uncharacterized protein n=1 Tax=Kineosporia succinea TaxID=84632 RepID=A0ABT9P9M9_9ACTN|nr:hypothetical protein [Kineosporia succinea]MDP9829407.1 hypothetical protein [Kineosporia succinea]
MKALILVAQVVDDTGNEWTEALAIADEGKQRRIPGHLRTMLDFARDDYEQVHYGYIDIEIPDEVIASVLRQYADAGMVDARPAVEEAR